MRIARFATIVRRSITALVIAAALPVRVAYAQQPTTSAPTPERARLTAAIDAYRGVPQKFEQSTGPFANFMGLYSRGYRCEYDETSAQRQPGMWEKTQFALWSDDRFLYGMDLDASPAVFQFQYHFLQNVIGADIYQMTRVDQLGAAAGIDDKDWQMIGIGIPNPEDYGRIGLRITPKFLAYPDVHAIGWLSYCGRGESDGYGRYSPLDSDIRFLQRKLDALPQ
jgi:hypothetical protein